MSGHGAFSPLKRKGIGAGEAASPASAEGYKRFTDEPKKTGWDVGFAYEGSGAETVKFFNENSNYDSLISSMSREERYDFREWTNGAFMNGQQYMGFDNMTTREKERTRTYDKYLDQATLDQGIVVHRLATAELVLGKGHRSVRSLDELKALKGRDVFSAGSMSTGAAAKGLTIGGTKNVEYRISIPGGTKGAGMWVGDSRINGWEAQQREFMTNRDVWFTVGDSTYDSKRGVYVVELKYKYRQQHDYGRSGR